MMLNLVHPSWAQLGVGTGVSPNSQDFLDRVIKDPACSRTPGTALEPLNDEQRNYFFCEERAGFFSCGVPCFSNTAQRARHYMFPLTGMVQDWKDWDSWFGNYGMESVICSHFRVGRTEILWYCLSWRKGTPALPLLNI